MSLFCPRCKNEYRDGFTQCSECNIPLVHPEKLSQALGQLQKGELVIVSAGTLDLMKRQQNLLNTKRIESIYKPASENECKTCVPTFHLIVSEIHAVEAHSIIQDDLLQYDYVSDNNEEAFTINYNQDKWHCPACGCDFVPQESCPECNLFIGIPIPQ